MSSRTQAISVFIPRRAFTSSLAGSSKTRRPPRPAISASTPRRRGHCQRSGCFKLTAPGHSLGTLNGYREILKPFHRFFTEAGRDGSRQGAVGCPVDAVRAPLQRVARKSRSARIGGVGPGQHCGTGVRIRRGRQSGRAPGTDGARIE